MSQVPIWLEVLSRIAAIITPVIGAAAAIYFAWKRWEIDRENLKNQRDIEIIKWSSEALDLISDIEMIIQNPSMDSDANKSLLKLNSGISSIIDRGRLYFPNTKVDVYGTHKPAGYQGFRQPILDCLVNIYNNSVSVFDSEVNRNNQKRLINNNRREFLSWVQGAVDPRRKIQFIERQNKKLNSI